MYSVTQRIAMTKQPYGGYLPVRNFKTVKLDDEKKLNDNENIHASLIGIAVDYLTRFMIGTAKKEAFKISLGGAFLLDKMLGESKYLKKAIILLDKVKGLDDLSIINACKLSGFDVVVRSGIIGYKPIENINPDKSTIYNIRIMVERSKEFLGKYGPVISGGFTFEGGYTDIISKGDGDYLTADTLWDFKVSKYNPTSKQTLQILIYYLMGKHSIHKEFDHIKKLGLYNPRKNVIRYVNIDKIPLDTIKEVCLNVIGYKLKDLKIDELLLDENHEEFMDPLSINIKDIVETSRKKGMRAIIQMDDECHIIKIYESVTKAAKTIGLNSKTIRDAAKGKYKHAGGYCWKYVDEVDEWFVISDII